jgi:hypothetical protein
VLINISVPSGEELKLGAFTDLFVPGEALHVFLKVEHPFCEESFFLVPYYSLGWKAGQREARESL